MTASGIRVQTIQAATRRLKLATVRLETWAGTEYQVKWALREIREAEQMLQSALHALYLRRAKRAPSGSDDD